MCVTHKFYIHKCIGVHNILFWCHTMHMSINMDLQLHFKWLQLIVWVCVCTCVCVQLLSCVQLFATPWTAAHQSPLSMGFSRQEYWSGLPDHLFSKQLFLDIYFKIFLTWTIFKVFIEFVTILFLFYVWLLCLRYMWDLISWTRD